MELKALPLFSWGERMGANRIKGITIEIDGETKGLDKALKQTNSTIKDTQSQLKDVERLLKLDPTNTVLLQQKQELLARSVEETEKKLETLKTANEQALKSADRYDEWKEKYDPIQQEIDETRKKLKELETAQRKLQKTGKTDTAQYASLQTEIKETSSRLEDLRQEAQKVNDEFGNPISHDEYNALQREIAETEASLKSLRGAADQTEGALQGVASVSQSTGSRLSGMCDVIKGGALLEAADQLSVVGDKIQEIGSAATEAFGESQNASIKAAAYFGETGEAAEETADLIENIFANGVGESMDRVADAVITVKKNLQDLDAEELSNLTQQAITLEDLYGVDMNETMRGVNALMNQFGLSAQEAMDYIVTGTQNGLDKTNELGDNLSEYSGKFAQAGYSAQEYFQLLQNGLEGGAYNLDKVNDAINEVTTRLADGTIEDAISSYSEQTQGLFEAWKNGEASQKDVIDSIIKDIANCTNQQEALNLAATAFGTMAEDGNQKFIESLTSVGDAYRSVSGSAANLFDQTTTPMQEMEANTRKLQQSLIPLGEIILNLANQILPPLVSGIQTVSDFFASLPEPIQNFIIILGALTAAFTALAPAIAAVAMAVTTLSVPILPLIAAIAGIAAAITGVIAIFQNWGSIVAWFEDVWEDFSNLIQGIPDWWSGIWQQVSDFFSGIWADMMGNPVISQTVDLILDVWNACKEELSSIWDTIKTVAEAAWTLIKNVVLGPVLLLCDLITGDFDKLGADAEKIWNNIKTAAVTIWTAIVKQGLETFNRLREGIAEILPRIAKIVIDGLQEAVDFITSLPGKAFEWGADFINGLADGIKNTIGKVVDAARSVGDTISEYLHFSRPDKGPLRDYESWMPDFIQGLAAGLRDNTWRLEKQVQLVAHTMSGSSPERADFSGVETILKQWLPFLGQQPSNQPVYLVLDSGALVGQIAPKMDRALGGIQLRNQRGG